MLVAADTSSGHARLSLCCRRAHFLMPWDFDLSAVKLQLPFVEWWNPRSRLWRQFSRTNRRVIHNPRFFLAYISNTDIDDLTRSSTSQRLGDALKRAFTDYAMSANRGVSAVRPVISASSPANALCQTLSPTLSRSCLALTVRASFVSILIALARNNNNKKWSVAVHVWPPPISFAFR